MRSVGEPDHLRVQNPREKEHVGSQRALFRSAKPNEMTEYVDSLVIKLRHGTASGVATGTQGFQAQVLGQCQKPTCEHGACSTWSVELAAAAPSSGAHESGQDLGFQF